MGISNEHNEHPANGSGELVQWLMIVAIVLSGVAVTAIWLYLQWHSMRSG
jgi:hypothetical protein